MKTLLPAALLLLAGLARAALPAVNLQVELRWVEATLPGAAQAGVRDGAVVVGTAGSVSPRGAQVTATAAAAPPPVQRLTVLNGQRAIVRLEQIEALEWLGVAAELDLQARPRRLLAQPRQGERKSVQGFGVAPSWPGGRAPVQLALDAQQDGAVVQTTVQLPLARWQTVARTGSASAPGARGTVGSRDAAGQPERELQLRVSVQP